jgi:hypothetical protein
LKGNLKYEQEESCDNFSLPGWKTPMQRYISKTPGPFFFLHSHVGCETWPLNKTTTAFSNAMKKSAFFGHSSSEKRDKNTPSPTSALWPDR